jgi:hypothetical protein
MQDNLRAGHSICDLFEMFYNNEQKSLSVAEKCLASLKFKIKA